LWPTYLRDASIFPSEDKKTVPTYTYECKKCGHMQDMFHSMVVKPRVKCEECGSSCKKLMGTGSGLIFKGSGFYETDYKNKSRGKSDSGESDSGKSESKSESKPESGKVESAKSESGSGDSTATSKKSSESKSSKGAEKKSVAPSKSD
jgi:putative FmdB family regulatory protein